MSGYPCGAHPRDRHGPVCSIGSSRSIRRKAGIDDLPTGESSLAPNALEAATPGSHAYSSGVTGTSPARAALRPHSCSKPHREVPDPLADEPLPARQRDPRAPPRARARNRGPSSRRAHCCGARPSPPRPKALLPAVRSPASGGSSGPPPRLVADGVCLDELVDVDPARVRDPRSFPRRRTTRCSA